MSRLFYDTIRFTIDVDRDAWTWNAKYGTFRVSIKAGRNYGSVPSQFVFDKREYSLFEVAVLENDEFVTDKFIEGVAPGDVANCVDKDAIMELIDVLKTFD